MGYARADSRPRLRCCTSRGRTHRTTIMLAVYGMTMAFGLSDKICTFPSDHSRDRRHSFDTEPSDRTVSPAPRPNVRIELVVPIADTTNYPLSYLLPGSREELLDGQGLQHLPLRLDEVEVERVFRPEHERSGSQGCFCAIQTSGSGRTERTRPRHQRCNPGVGRSGRAGG